MKALLILAALASGERPSSAPPVDERLTGIENRLDTVESRVDALEGKTTTACPCPDGPCICGAECDCPNCPIHKKADGRRVLFFTADWCVPCQQAKARLGTLIEQCEVIDCTEGNPCPEYGVTAYPTALLIEGGETKSRCVGEHIGPLILGGWLAAQADESRPVPGAISVPVSRPTVSVSSLFYSPGRSSWTWPGDLRQHMASEHGYTLSSLNSMSDQSVISLHEQLHSGNRQPAQRTQTVRYSQPTYQPRTYFRQQSYCPSCAR